MEKFFIILIIILVFLFPILTSAIEFKNPLGTDDLEEILNKIWSFLYKLALALVPIMAIILGFMFLTAGGDPDKIKRARDFALWAAIGLVIILLAGGIVKLIKEILGVNDGEGSLNYFLELAKIIKNLI